MCDAISAKLQNCINMYTVVLENSSLKLARNQNQEREKDFRWMETISLCTSISSIAFHKKDRNLVIYWDLKNSKHKILKSQNLNFLYSRTLNLEIKLGNIFLLTNFTKFNVFSHTLLIKLHSIYSTLSLSYTCKPHKSDFY